jgi:hypothetical protein
MSEEGEALLFEGVGHAGDVEKVIGEVVVASLNPAAVAMASEVDGYDSTRRRAAGSRLLQEGLNERDERPGVAQKAMKEKEGGRIPGSVSGLKRPVEIVNRKAANADFSLLHVHVARDLSSRTGAVWTL